MSRNPIYQALLSTRMMHSLVRSTRHDERLAAARDTFERDLAAIRDLMDRGIISGAECSDLSRRAARPFHAKVLWLLRSETSHRTRRRFARQAIVAHSGGVRL